MASPSNVLLLTGLAVLIATITLEAAEPEKVQNNRWIGGGEAEGELRLLQFIFRHGDRTPYWVYKNDIYKDSDYPEGVGMLVNKGKERMYSYGKKLRKRYSSYVDNMLMKNIRAQSSPIRRCIETSLAVLAGFFPPTKSFIWTQSLRWPEVVLSKIWQPIAVETVEENRSWKLNPDAPCKTASKIEKDMETTVPELKKFLEDNHEFIEQVGKYSGEDYFNNLNWLWVGYLYDTFFSQKEYFGSKFRLPDWVNKMNNTMERLSKFNDMVFSIYGQSPEFIKLRAGTFLKEVIGNLRDAANLTQITASNKKLFTYGSHDTFVAYVMHALGLYKAQPSYGSGLIFELRKHDNQNNVHLFYANVTTDNTSQNFDIYKLKLNESPRFSALCKQSYCSVENFATSLAAYLENNAEKDCQNGS